MKPESLLESDPINIYLARKPKMPFKALDEVPNGSYGLVISGCSLVGNTEPRCFLIQITLSLDPTQFREILSLLYFMGDPIPLPWGPLPERQLSPGYSRQEYKKEKPRKFLLYSLL